MNDPTDLLAAYDAQLRGVAEVRTMPTWEQVGPLWRGISSRGGFVSYEDLAGHDVSALIAATVRWFAEQTDVGSFEWKTRGHDDLPGLHEMLLSTGFVPEEVETVMVGPVEGLAVDVAVPDGVDVRCINDEPDLLAQSTAMQRAVFGGGPDDAELVRKGAGSVEKWAAVHGDVVVSAGRLDVVEDTDFAGLWGGATVPEWRGRGIYRAVTAGRARSAMTRGVRLMHSDCTAMSRPILQRSGLVPVTTTTPYVWSR